MGGIAQRQNRLHAFVFAFLSLSLSLSLSRMHVIITAVASLNITSAYTAFTLLTCSISSGTNQCRRALQFKGWIVVCTSPTIWRIVHGDPEVIRLDLDQELIDMGR